MENKFLSINAVSALLGITRTTLMNWRNRARKGDAKDYMTLPIDASPHVLYDYDQVMKDAAIWFGYSAAFKQTWPDCPPERMFWSMVNRQCKGNIPDRLRPELADFEAHMRAKYSK